MRRYRGAGTSAATGRLCASRHHAGPSGLSRLGVTATTFRPRALPRRHLQAPPATAPVRAGRDCSACRPQAFQNLQQPVISGRLHRRNHLARLRHRAQGQASAPRCSRRSPANSSGDKVICASGAVLASACKNGARPPSPAVAAEICAARKARWGDHGAKPRPDTNLARARTDNSPGRITLADATPRTR